MARKKEGQDPLVQQEVRAIGSKNSDLAKSTAIEAKVSKADMTNIIKQNLLDKLEEEKRQLNNKYFTINNNIAVYLKELESTLTPSYLKAVAAYGIKAEKEYLRFDIKGTKDSNYIPEIKVEARYYRNAPLDIPDILEEATKGLFKKVHINTHSIRNYHGDLRDVLNFIFPEATIHSDEYEALVKKLNQCSKDINEINAKITKFTDTSYLRAKLDMGILAGTTNGTDVVNNINLLAESIIKQNTTPLLPN